MCCLYSPGYWVAAGLQAAESVFLKPGECAECLSRQECAKDWKIFNVQG